MAEHQHDYRKLNDEAVFCRGCGDIKSVASPICTLPHYPVVPWYPVYPTWPTYPWWSGTTFTTGTATGQLDTTTVTAITETWS